VAAPLADTRRDPRLLVRCRAALSHGARRWEIETEDLSAGGCQFRSPVALQRGQAVWLEVHLPGDAGAEGPFAVAATVAWVSRQGPLRLGLEFSRAGRATRERRLALLARHRRVAPPAASGAGARGRRGEPGPSASSDRPAPPPGPGPGRERSARAQTFLDLARQETAAGRAVPALEWLRAAHAVAPDDAEITEELELAEKAVQAGSPPPGDRRPVTR
jgi:hypothetical protein